MNFKERRKAVRVDTNLPLAITGEPGGAEGRTINISTNGVLFQSPKFMDVLTKVRLELVIPPRGGDKGQHITCDGVVVRVDPEQEDPAESEYRIAVFFTYMSKSSQEMLARYIKGLLAAS